MYADRIGSRRSFISHYFLSRALRALVLLGDLVSVYLAVLRGIDPTPVAEIDGLKERLGDG